MFTGIEIGNKHSLKDFNLTIVKREIGYPSKIKRQEKVPYSNEIYDFSNIYGGQEYDERPLSYTFNIVDKSKRGSFKEEYIDFNFYETAVINWLMGINGKSVLKDDTLPGYYFLAEIVNGPTNEFRFIGGELSVQFTAYPFKISELHEGHDIWDEFNFLLDYAQITEFTINGAKEIILYNPGISVLQPKIVASNEFEIIKGDTIFNVPSGESQSHDFILHQGENKLTITGNGTIEFLFYKELI